MLDNVAFLLPAAWAVAHGLTLDGDQPRDRLERFGFRFRVWRDEPWRLATHCMVHANAEHLAANVVSFFAAMLAAHNAPFRLPAPVEGLVTVGTFFVGAICGGLSAIELDTRRDRARVQAKHGFSIPIVETVVGKVHKIASRYTTYCGASAGVCAVAAFHTTRSVLHARRSTRGALPIAVARVLLASAPEAFLALRVAATGDGDGISHASHVGGFVVGAVCGAVVHYFT